MPSGKALSTAVVCDTSTNTFTSMSIVPRARSVHHARASAPPNAWATSTADSASWMAMIFSGSAVKRRPPIGRTGELEPLTVACREERGEFEDVDQFLSPGRPITVTEARCQVDFELESGGSHDAIEGFDRGHFPVRFVGRQRGVRGVSQGGQRPQRQPGAFPCRSERGPCVHDLDGIRSDTTLLRSAGAARSPIADSGCDVAA